MMAFNFKLKNTKKDEKKIKIICYLFPSFEVGETHH
jgi:hypothetical protein